MSSEDQDISRIFSQKVERRFQRDFGRFIGGGHHSSRYTSTPNELKRITQSTDNSLNVKLIEAKEEIDSLHRKLNSKNEEIERLKAVENTSKAKIEELNIQLDELKMEIDKGKRKSFDFSEDKSKEKLLLSDYRNALSKYKTWTEFADKQLNEMKIILKEIGGWTEAIRYRIYFAYRGIAPEMVTDEMVTSLSTGSVINYPGNIENIEGITASEYRPRFHCVSTQTEGASLSSEENKFVKPLPPQNSSEGMSANELRLLDCERQIEQLEIQNAQMREQLIIFGDRAKNVELLEEQKDDLKLQLSILVRQNQKLLDEQEQFKSAFSGGEEQLRLKNEHLTKRLKILEDQREGLSLAESRRIAKIFKQKYEKEMAQLRSKLEEYEKGSDTTRICRFVQRNPLDEAHDDHVVKQVAAEATAAAKFGVNSLKRRKMEDDIDSSQPANNSDLTFLVEEEENEEDPSTIRELRLQLANVKTLVEQNEQSNSEYLAQYKEFVKLLCGYDIRFGEDGFCEAENILSKDCTFLFQKQQIPLDVECTSSTQITTGAGIDLLDSESARQWKDVLENYLIRYQSIPAFLSAVTIALVESPETPVSSSRQSSIEEITSSHNSNIDDE
uniref:Uncharacterized protein n=1 Tax=Meloidogyne enterolobii TaxID=390850 RepID=A0A6V7TKY8_MELEN|nr:unnamed protein product [Meloidogyne enterolobii]